MSESPATVCLYAGLLLARSAAGPRVGGPHTRACRHSFRSRRSGGGDGVGGRGGKSTLLRYSYTNPGGLRRGSGLGERNSEKVPPDENIADVRPLTSTEETRKHEEDADRAMKERLEEAEKAAGAPVRALQEKNQANVIKARSRLPVAGQHVGKTEEHAQGAARKPPAASLCVCVTVVCVCV